MGRRKKRTSVVSTGAAIAEAEAAAAGEETKEAEYLERCTRVPDAPRRLWSARMCVVNSLVGEVLELEQEQQRMAASGVEVPSSSVAAEQRTSRRRPCQREGG